MYNMSFGQETETTGVDSSRPIEVEPESRVSADRFIEEEPVTEQVVLVPAAVGMSTGQKVGLGIGLAAAGTITIGGIIAAVVMKSREGY